MMDRRIFLTRSAITIPGIVGLVGCTEQGGSGQGSGEPSSGNGSDGGGGGGNESTNGSGGRNGTQGNPVVAMVTNGSDYYFNPIGLYVTSRTTVTFRNKSGRHSSTAYKKGTASAQVTRIPTNAAAWNSGILSEQGATFKHTFETAGTYDYFCIPHKSLGMVARIVVDEPGGPAEGSMPPDGKVPKSQRIVDAGAISYSEFNK